MNERHNRVVSASTGGAQTGEPVPGIEQVRAVSK